MLKSLRNLWSSVSGGPHERKPQHSFAQFQLRYGSLPVGVLSNDAGHWTFRYTAEFQRRQDLRPLVQFPDTSKTYESEELWPFFGMRIPSLKQPFVKKVVKGEKINARDKVELLRRFGRRTIANPYELIES